MDASQQLVCVVGVGVVGQRSIEIFSSQYNVIGYDVCAARVAELQAHYAGTPRVTIQGTTCGIEAADVFCISVPTLLKDDQSIDISRVEAAVETVSQHARPGATVVSVSDSTPVRQHCTTPQQTDAPGHSSQRLCVLAL